VFSLGSLLFDICQLAAMQCGQSKVAHGNRRQMSRKEEHSFSEDELPLKGRLARLREFIAQSPTLEPLLAFETREVER